MFIQIHQRILYFVRYHQLVHLQINQTLYHLLVQPANQDIIVTNTYFNPIVLDIEMVDHDFETLSYWSLW